MRNRVWVIPPEADAESVAPMEKVLDTNEKVNEMVQRAFSCSPNDYSQKPDQQDRAANLLDIHYSKCKTISLICDNLNAHEWSILRSILPERARTYVQEANFVYTPKHGRWLNVAECELSCLTSQCLSARRTGELEELQTEIKAWSDKTNSKQRGVDWQFKINERKENSNESN